MLMKPDCIPCILRMLTSSIRKLTDDEDSVKELITRALRVPALRGENWTLTSPQAIEPVLDIIMETFHTEDPFRALKEEENAKALELYPSLKQLVKESEAPLFAAVNLAIQGNAVDLMVTDRSIDVKEVLTQELKNPVLEKAFQVFREKLGKARRVLYLGDNSGEIVFDKVLIETITAMYDVEIIFVVRGVPALNDVTLHEALSVGMDQAATRVISNGMKHSVPGTILSRCSSELRDLFQSCDLIISKGGGNFDSLEAEKDRFNIFFMLIAKCLPFSRYFKIKLHQPILANFFE